MTFKELKDRIRGDIWSSGEARSRRTAHDHYIIDALIEIQKYVECWQQNNTHLIPHCSTHYNCGLTSFDFHRAYVKGLSVVDRKISPDSGVKVEDVTIADSSLTETGVSVSYWGGIAIAAQELTAALLASYDWENANTTNPAFRKFTFASRKLVTSMTLVVNYAAYATQPTTFTIQASNDGSTWTTLLIDNRTEWDSGDMLTFSFTDNTAAWLHYRMTITPTTISDPLFNISTGRMTLLGSTTPSATQYTEDNDWCSEIHYDQVDPCFVHGYLDGSSSCGSCLPIGLYFGIPQACTGGKGVVPVPTDEGVPAGLPILPLGYHYPQESTDSTRRATRGVWAVERGRIFIAPWIQSTETIVVKWDGIKRDWVDGDLLDGDPDLIRTVKLWVQKEVARDEDRDVNSMQSFEREFNLSLQDMLHTCIEETRTRECEQSKARGIVSSGATPLSLYYNDAQTNTAYCPAGTTGDSVTVTIPSGTVGSSISKSDANSRAQIQAQAQAQAQLVCVSTPTTYYNVAQSYTAQCTQADDAPVPDGSPVTITIEAGEYSSTISQTVANSLAYNAAVLAATQALECTYYNREVTVSKDCPDGDPEPAVEATVAAGQHTSTISQAVADQLATTAANNAAQALLETECGSAPAQVGNPPFVHLRPSFRQAISTGPFPPPGTPFTCFYDITVTVAENFVYAGTQGDAYNLAVQIATELANSYAASIESQTSLPCNDISVNLPP